MFRTVSAFLAAALVQTLAGCGGSSSGGNSSASIPIPPVANACARPAAGSVVSNPPDLFSKNGVLKVDFSYQTRVDADGRNLFCFMTPDGLEDPTLHVNPGDHLIINLMNNTPATNLVLKIDKPNCGANTLTASSVNMHFHGTNTSPRCHADQVIKTMVNSGQAFHYDVQFPKDEPPGLYWYHPHAHMLVESALQGGGSGAIEVEGIQNFVPTAAGLTQQFFVMRDQNVAGNPTPGGDIPSWDITINNIPIAYPAETPAIIQMTAGEPQLWRVSNSSADTILDMQVQYDGVPQTVQIVAFDGVPAGSQDGSTPGTPVPATDVLIPTAGRAEFIVNPPGGGVTTANLITLAINTGPDGDNDPQRTIANIQTMPAAAAAAISTTSGSASSPAAQTTASAVSASAKVSANVGAKWPQRFAGLATATSTTSRTFFFSENNPESQFFITEQGATPVLFDPNNPPAVVTTQGSVEEWTIQNQSLENHEFHIHQIHFLVESQDNFTQNGTTPDPSIDGQVLDTIQVPFWDGNPNDPFPSVTLKLDFRGPDTGDFVYHCHIAEHEDDGMMAIIRVEPSSTAAAVERARLSLVALGESIGLIRGPDIAATEKVYAWCVRGQLARKRGLRTQARTEIPRAVRISEPPVD
jgi:FtsP/CotA-like multicopper oxidase with cupredoxin domain